MDFTVSQRDTIIARYSTQSGPDKSLRAIDCRAGGEGRGLNRCGAKECAEIFRNAERRRGYGGEYRRRGRMKETR